MTWADRLLRLAVGDPKREVADQLLAVYQRSAARARRLSAAAAQAPTAAAENELRALATKESELTAAATRALQERGAAVPDPAVSDPPFNGAARNHWARLVSALEASQQARGELLRHTPRLLELDASLADFLPSLLRALDSEVLGLRAMIARADPQAIN